MLKSILKYDDKKNLILNEETITKNETACEAIVIATSEINKQSKDSWIEKVFGDYEGNPFTARAEVFGIVEKDRVKRKLKRPSNVTLATIDLAIDTKNDQSYNALSEADKKSEKARVKKERNAYSTLFLKPEELKSFANSKEDWIWATFPDMVRAYTRSIEEPAPLKLGQTKPAVMDYLGEFSEILDDVSFDIEDPENEGKPLTEISEDGNETKAKDHFDKNEKIQLFQVVGLRYMPEQIKQFAKLLETNPNACLEFLENNKIEEKPEPKKKKVNG